VTRRYARAGSGFRFASVDRWVWAVDLLEEPFDAWVVFVRNILVAIAAVLFHRGRVDQRA
jgi:hypothetical protein